MIPAYKHLIYFAIAKGWKIAVDNEEDFPDWDVYTDPAKAAEEVDAVDGGAEFALIKDGERDIWVQPAIGYGNDPEETIADYYVNPFMDLWEAQYKADEEKFKDFMRASEKKIFDMFMEYTSK